MPIALLVLQFLPYLLQAVLAVEQTVKDAKSGQVKKATVLAGAQAALDAAAAAGAPISPTEKDALQTGIANTVDGLVTVFNAHGWPGQPEGSGR